MADQQLGLLELARGEGVIGLSCILPSRAIATALSFMPGAEQPPAALMNRSTT